MYQIRTQSLILIGSCWKRSVILFVLMASVFMVSACNDNSGDGDVLSAPSGLKATAGNAKISLTWNPVSGATSYNLYFSTLDGTAENGTVISGITNTRYTHSSLVNTTAYYYVVRAVITGAVESQPSDAVSATPMVDMIAGRYLPIGLNTGIIRDVEIGLEWQRCRVGQTWLGGACVGPGWEYNWDDAIELSASGGFRIPTSEELRTIVYCSNTGNFDSNGNDSSCEPWGTYDRPTIVLEAFPNTPSHGPSVWSSSPSSSDFPDRARCVNFSYGRRGQCLRSHDGFHVLLVRVGQ